MPAYDFTNPEDCARYLASLLNDKQRWKSYEGMAKKYGRAHADEARKLYWEMRNGQARN